MASRRQSRLTAAISILALFLLALTSCNMGTDVGNGLKPKEPVKNGDGPEGASNDTPEIDTMSKMSIPTPTEALILALNTCASPFAESTNGVFLGRSEADNDTESVTVESLDAKRNIIKFNETEIIVTSAPRVYEDYAVNIDVTRGSIDNEHVTCSRVVSENLATLDAYSDVTRRQVTLTERGKKYILTWYLRGITSDYADERLLKIQLSPEQGKFGVVFTRQ